MVGYLYKLVTLETYGSWLVITQGRELQMSQASIIRFPGLSFSSI
jgi:hypothetical protein